MSLSTLTHGIRYFGTKMGCACGLARKVKFTDLMKQFEESELEETESLSGVIPEEILEANPLLLDMRKD